MTSRRLGAAFAVVVVALGIASCGNGTNEPARGLPATAALVGPKDIAATEAGTPNHAFMLWWRSLQYADVQGYNRRLSNRLKARPGHAQTSRRQVAAVAGQVINIFPHIVRVEASGARATLYVELEVRTLVGAERYTTTRVPRAFPMIRQAGWKLDDDLFVEASARAELQKLAADDARAGTAPAPTATTASPSLLPVPTPSADAAPTPRRTQTTPRAPAGQPSGGSATTTTTTGTPP